MSQISQRVSVDQCQAFIAVLETKSFSLAGERLLRSQSAITHKIKGLEALIGDDLFLRTRGHFGELTETGKKLEPLARRILAAVEDVSELHSQQNIAGTVRLGVLNDFDLHGLTASIGRFERKHPNLRVEIISDVSIKLKQRFENRELDIVLLKDVLEHDEAPTIETCKIERLHWVASYGFNWDSTTESLPLIVFPEGCAYRRRIIEILTDLEYNWHFAYTSHSYDRVREAISAGLGVSALPESQIGHDHRICDGASSKFCLPTPGFSNLSLNSSGDEKSPQIDALRKLLLDNIREARKKGAADASCV